MRVLLVVHGYPPEACGGTESYTRSLARALAARGEQVTVLAREANPAAEEYSVRQEDDQGVQVYRVNNTFARCRTFRQSYLNEELEQAVEPILRACHAEVAQVEHLTCLSVGLVERLARQMPVILTLNDYWMLCHRGQLLDHQLNRCDGPGESCQSCLPPLGSLQHTLLNKASSSLAQQRISDMRQALAAAHSLIAPSETLKQRFAAFGVPEQKLLRREQGIESAFFQDALPLSTSPLKLGFFGSLMVSKAPGLLLEACAPLGEQVQVHLFGPIADYHGDSSYGGMIEPLLQNPQVKHHGSLAHEAIPAQLAQLDAVVVPSIWLENAPFVIREAQAAGRPVIASRLGGMAEMVEHDVNGLLFAPGDMSDLRRAIQRLLNEPELLPQLGRGARPMITIEEDAQQLVELYSSAMAQFSSPDPPPLAAIVLNYNTPHDTLLAVRSLQSSRRPVQQIIVVDNNSTDGSEPWLRERLPGITLLQTGENLGFSGGCNVGIQHALRHGAEAIFLLNGDAMVTADTLALLEQALEQHPEAGLAGPLVLWRGDPRIIASAGISYSRRSGRMRHLRVGELLHGRSEGQQLVPALSGCALWIQRRVLQQAGMLDEGYFFTFEDIEFCLRAAQHGFSSLLVEHAIAYHQGSGSIGYDSPQRIYFATRNHLRLAAQLNDGRHLPAAARWGHITALNLAHAARGCSGVPATKALGAVLAGLRDHLRGSYGAGDH